MNWLLLVILLAGAAAWFWHRRNFLRHLRRAGEIIDDVTAGRRPRGFIFRHSHDFSGLAWRLEHLSDEHELLIKQVEEKKFNLDAILSSMAEGVLVVTEKRFVRLVNKSFCRMFGLAAEPIGHSVLRATRDAAVDALIGDALAGAEIEARDISAGAQHFSVSAVPLKSPGGAVSGVVAVFHDVSRLRQLEDGRRDFVANVSHELRTPLSIFHGYLETLMDDPPPPPDVATESLAIMRKHSRRLNALADDLLALARLEARQEKFDFRDLDLAPFLGSMLHEWRQKFARKKVTATLEVPPQLRLRADPDRLEQALGNLLDNALKFSGEGGAISLRGEKRGDRIELRVQDNGVGIPPADLPRIFERFYRVDKSRSRDAGGTGLGLSIVKHIVALHDGEVRAESAYGQGTAIILSFPDAPR